MDCFLKRFHNCPKLSRIRKSAHFVVVLLQKLHQKKLHHHHLRLHMATREDFQVCFKPRPSIRRAKE